jgi:hypothetical protein
MGSAGIDDDLEIGLACDRLLRGWCPVVFFANQDENGNAMTPAPSWLAGFFESVASSDE